MMARIVGSAGNAAETLAYVLRERERDKGITEHILTRGTQGLAAREIAALWKMNRDLFRCRSKYQCHHSITSFRDDERVDDRQALDLTEMFALRLYGPARRTILALHPDGHQRHCHQVAEWVDSRGKGFDSRNDFWRGIRIAAELAKEHGLFVVSGTAWDNDGIRCPDQPDALTTQLRRAIDAAVAQAGGDWEQFEQELGEEGIKVRIKVDGSGQPCGLLYRAADCAPIPGSRLGPQYSYPAVLRRLRQIDVPDPEGPEPEQIEKDREDE